MGAVVCGRCGGGRRRACSRPDRRGCSRRGRRSSSRRGLRGAPVTSTAVPAVTRRTAVIYWRRDLARADIFVGTSSSAGTRGWGFSFPPREPRMAGSRRSPRRQEPRPQGARDSRHWRPNLCRDDRIRLRSELVSEKHARKEAKPARRRPAKPAASFAVQQNLQQNLRKIDEKMSVGARSEQQPQ